MRMSDMRGFFRTRLPLIKPTLHTMKKKAKRSVKAWAVIGTPRDKGGLTHHSGYPMIFIQNTKPIVLKIASEKKETVIRCTITYDLP